MDEDKIKNHVAISEDLDGDLVGLPTLLWHYGSIEATAYEAALMAKADMEQAHARAYKVLKELSRKDKATEAQIAAEIELDPEYRRYSYQHIEAEGNARRMRALVESLRAKKDALIQLGSNHRTQVRAGVDHVRR